MLTSLDSSEAL